MESLTVIKAGTGVLTRSDGTLDGASLVRLVTAIAGLVESGHRCLLVSSGAVGAGVSAFGLEGYPTDLATKQACAAVGQARLMHTYENLFRNFNLAVAQVLLTAADINTPERRGYVTNTLHRLLKEPGIVPIINENDSVAVEELRVGDNDMLSAQVAALVGAKRLILLTSVDGLLSPDDNSLVNEVEDVSTVLGYAKDERGRFSIGGMASKLQAVKLAVEAGITTHIAHGRKPERLAGILAGQTAFPPVSLPEPDPAFPMNELEVRNEIETLARQAREASYRLSQLSTEQKNAILRAMAAGLRASVPELMAANILDLTAGEAKGLSSAMLDRLRLDEKRIEAIASGIDQVATLPDPTGEVMASWSRPNGMRLEQVRVPIGTIGIIYESRPNVTSDAAVLCFKTGNATILRGGSEAIHSNRAIAAALIQGGVSAGMPEHAIQLIPFTDRSSVTALCQMDKWLDLIIPRGGKSLIETVVSQARMPVIKHYDGICHTYVDAAADLDMAVKLAIDAKTQKPGVCNALETLLVHADVAKDFLPLAAAAFQAKGVELRGCERTRGIIEAIPASEDDWSTEYLDLILSIKVVDSLEEAVAHINHYGSHHSECIVTRDEAAAEAFLRGCDSACVFHNVSTRFADGEEFGFGAEIGISTDKLHARGPMGLRELTSYQYRIHGEGQTKG